MPKSNRKKYSAFIDWKQFDGDDIILPICPRSKAVNGRGFIATLDAMQEKIRSVKIIHCAQLDVHNYVGRKENPLLRTQENKDRWRRKFLPEVINRFEVSEYDWADVQADDGYLPRMHALKKLYDSDPYARALIDKTANYYLEHHARLAKNRRLPFNWNDEKQRSVQYLIDEFAGTSVYGSWFRELPEIYWGTFIQDTQAFNRTNQSGPLIDLSLPETIPVTINRLEKPQPVFLKELVAA